VSEVSKPGATITSLRLSRRGINIRIINNLSYPIVSLISVSLSTAGSYHQV